MKLKLKCMNSVPDPDKPGITVFCGWQGDLLNNDQPCPRCFHTGTLAPVVDLPRMEGM